MTVDHGVRVVAGTMVLIGLGLGYWLSAYGYLLSAFVGVNLIQSAFTGLCPAEAILKRCGLKSGGGCS